MEITKDTRVSDILEEYGDIADVMEVFGVQRVGRYSLRTFLAKALTVETEYETGRHYCAIPASFLAIQYRNPLSVFLRQVCKMFPVRAEDWVRPEKAIGLGHPSLIGSMLSYRVIVLALIAIKNDSILAFSLGNPGQVSSSQSDRESPTREPFTQE